VGFPASALAQRSPPDLKGDPPGMSDRKLPETGAAAGLVGLAGMGLPMAGFGLRLRLPGG
jgi:hypothetical protein